MRGTLMFFSRSLCLGLCLTLAGGAGSAELHRYHVQLMPGAAALAVRACFAAPAPARLTAHLNDARRHISDVRISGLEGAKAQLRGQHIHLHGVRPGDCLFYRVDLSGAADAARRAPVSRVGEDVRTDPRVWLWRPEIGDMEIAFELPSGWSVSTPWQSTGDDRYRLGPESPEWPATVAFGRLERFEIAVRGARLDVALLDGRPPPGATDLRQWLEDAARALVGAYGRFPVPRAQLLVVPVDWERGAQEAVPFAHVLRGGGSAIEFFVNTRRPLSEFLSDWTAVHEFSHLLHPLLSEDATWLSEGIASYYQNVLRARNGVLSPSRAWQKLHAGFQRGIGQTRGRRLSDVTRTMHRDRSYMRVYWSGAAVALLADVALRAGSENRMSLDSALDAFAGCCLPAERRWSGGDFMARLDALTASGVFAELYARYATSRDFPEVAGVLDQLGVRIDSEGRVLLTAAGSAYVRDAIMAPNRDAGAEAIAARPRGCSLARSATPTPAL